MRNRLLLTLGLTAAVLVLIGAAANILWFRLAAKPIIILAMIIWVMPFDRRYRKWCSPQRNLQKPAFRHFLLPEC